MSLEALSTLFKVQGWWQHQVSSEDNCIIITSVFTEVRQKTFRGVFCEQCHTAEIYYLVIERTLFMPYWDVCLTLSWWLKAGIPVWLPLRQTDGIMPLGTHVPGLDARMRMLRNSTEAAGPQTSLAAVEARQV